MTEPRSEQQEGLGQDGVAEGARDENAVSRPEVDSAQPSGPEDRAVNLEEG